MFGGVGKGWCGGFCRIASYTFAYPRTDVWKHKISVTSVLTCWVVSMLNHLFFHRLTCNAYFFTGSHN